jgi:hypothetical protein
MEMEEAARTTTPTMFLNLSYDLALTAKEANSPRSIILTKNKDILEMATYLHHLLAWPLLKTLESNNKQGIT